MDGKQISLLLLPLVVGFGTSAIFKMREDVKADKVAARPPKPAFGILWMIWYILLGVILASKAENRTTKILLGVLIGFFAIWQVLASTVIGTGWRKSTRKWGLYVILLSLILNMSAVHSSNVLLHKCFMSGIAVWLIFATMLSVQNLQIEDK